MLLCEVTKFLRYEARVTRGYEGTAPVLLSPYSLSHGARLLAPGRNAAFPWRYQRGQRRPRLQREAGRPAVRKW